MFAHITQDRTSAALLAVAAGRFDLVVFDTARRVFAVKDENDNAEFYAKVALTLAALRAWLQTQALPECEDIPPCR